MMQTNQRGLECEDDVISVNLWHPNESKDTAGVNVLKVPEVWSLRGDECQTPAVTHSLK